MTEVHAPVLDTLVRMNEVALERSGFDPETLVLVRIAAWASTSAPPAYGIGALDDARGFSLMAGHTYGRVIGIIARSLGAIGALLSVGGNHPWWSLIVFALCVIVVHGIVVYGEEDRVAGT
jgi:hypothetical protein